MAPTVRVSLFQFITKHLPSLICTNYKRRAGDLYPILKLERNARVLNRIKVEL